MADAELDAEGALWVFGYGSLMWEPGFRVVETWPARLWGYHRALCILSIRNRGTPEAPGLVVGLDRGGSCVGRALKVSAKDTDTTLDYLHRREMSTAAYRPRHLKVQLAAGRQIKALTFLARPGHPQYVTGLSLEAQVKLIRQGVGAYGSSLDYLRSLCTHLRELRIAAPALTRVLALAEGAAIFPATEEEKGNGR